jgi:hypothetical protein
MLQYTIYKGKIVKVIMSCIARSEVTVKNTFPFLEDITVLTLLSFIFRHLARLLGRGIGPSQGLYLHKTQKYEDKHLCLERDSNPRSQYSSSQDPHRAATVINIETCET